MGIKKRFGAFSVPGDVDFEQGRFPYNPNPVASGALSDLTDVSITSPNEGQTLYYDATISKWKNNSILEVDDTTTRGGIIVGEGITQPMISFPRQADTANAMYGMRGISAFDDPWFVGAGSTGNDQGYLEIATGDNTGDPAGDASPIYVRQYDGYSGGANVPWYGGTGVVVNQLTLLDEDGHTIIPNNLTVDSGTLFVDATNNRVGINNTSPQYELHIDNGSDGINQFAMTNSSRSFIITNNDGNDTLSFNYNNANRLEFDTTNAWFNSGRLGINTATPAYTLDVNGTANIETTLTVPSITTLTGDDLNITAFSGRDVTISTTAATDPVTIVRNTTSTGSGGIPVRTLTLRLDSTGTPVVGFGSQLEFETESTPGTFVPSGYITNQSTGDNAGVLDDFKMSFGVMSAGTSTNRMELDNLGNLQIDGDLTVTGGDITLNGSTSGSVKLSAGATPAVQTYTLPSAYPTISNLVLTSSTSGTLSWIPVTSTSGGDVVGPSSSTDNAIVRFNGTSGKIIQNSGITISDSEWVEGVERLYMKNALVIIPTEAPAPASGAGGVIAQSSYPSELGQTYIHTIYKNQDNNPSNTNFDIDRVSPIADYFGAKYSIVVTMIDTNSGAIARQISEVLVTHDGTTVSVVDIGRTTSTDPNNNTSFMSFFGTITTVSTVVGFNLIADPPVSTYSKDFHIVAHRTLFYSAV